MTEPIGRISTRDYIDLRIKNVEDKIDSLEKYQTQHFELNELAIKKAEEAMLTRLESMNEFRSQINAERSEYVTKEALEMSVKERNARLESLEKSNAFAAGKWWMIVIIVTAVPTILALIALFRG